WHARCSPSADAPDAPPATRLMNDGRPDDLSADRTSLDSREFRTRLLTKLNCLIAVIEVAIAKVARSLEAPGANEERLNRIRANLENTLAICQRAKSTLQRTTAGGHGGGAARRQDPRARRMGYRDYVELSSIDEYRKFKTLPPIRPDDIRSADLDDLVRRLAGS